MGRNIDLGGSFPIKDLKLGQFWVSKKKFCLQNFAGIFQKNSFFGVAIRHQNRTPVYFELAVSASYMIKITWQKLDRETNLFQSLKREIGMKSESYKKISEKKVIS